MGSIIAMIMAAGSSRRMGENKLLLACGKENVLRRTLRAFDEVEGVDKILLVCSDDAILDNLPSLHKPLITCSGGAERSDSVRRGLEQLDHDDFVLIHDAARPFVSQELLKRCVQWARRGKSFLPVVSAVDTIKWQEPDGRLWTPPREQLFYAQTPQGFPVGLLKKCMDQYAGEVFTDEASVIEKAGLPLQLIEGERQNIKITTREDMLRCDWDMESTSTALPKGENSC